MTNARPCPDPDTGEVLYQYCVTLPFQVILALEDQALPAVPQVPEQSSWAAYIGVANAPTRKAAASNIVESLRIV